MTKAVYFSSAAEFRAWLRAHHDKKSELIVGYYKVATKKDSMTWSESVDEALCYGWIDGIRRRVDDERYTIRFTPRKPSSNWSKVNIEKVQKLIRGKRMRKAGLLAWEKYANMKSGSYSYENEDRSLDAEKAKRLKADKKAWTYFEAQPPSYRRQAEWWVMSAKKEETRERRFAKLIESCREGLKIPPLRS